MLSLLLACAGPPDVVPGGSAAPPAPAPAPDPARLQPRGPELPPLPRLVVNELMSANASTVNVPDGAMADWVELLNADAEPVALDRVELRDRDGNSWRGSAEDGSLAPGERRVLWLAEGSGGGFTGFALDADGDALVVRVDDRPLDVVEVPALGADVALARLPDTTGALRATAWPTPGAPNGDEASPTLDPADATWFVTGTVHRIDLLFPPRTRDELDDPARPEVRAALRVDGVTFPAVGLRLKGSASYQRMDKKPSFVVDLDAWVEGTELRGLRTFKLHNGVMYDPTRVHEHLTYRLARETGLMAPRVGWARVFCNGEDYGLYVVVEAHDERFVRYHHPDQEETGVVLEPNEGLQGNTWTGDFGRGEALGWDMEEGPDPADPRTLEALAQVDEIVTRPATDANVDELFRFMDQDLLLTYLAWETVVMHADGYRITNNWRVYVDGETHLVSLLPSGAEMTWAAPVDAWGFVGRVARFCFENASCRRDYAARLVEVADHADELRLDEDFVAQSRFLDPWIEADPRYPAVFSVDHERRTTLERLRENPEEARSAMWAEFPELRP